ncbi:MAG: phosphatidylinositol-3,5-bisphosphate 5-phosphatase [Pycnora praestabilis]|nr:MAG: phosphatidylinositol-3,5-bisphosphate 5-phosphatase [Pycnora praestabilis]
MEEDPGILEQKEENFERAILKESPKSMNASNLDDSATSRPGTSPIDHDNDSLRKASLSPLNPSPKLGEVHQPKAVNGSHIEYQSPSSFPTLSDTHPSPPKSPQLPANIDDDQGNEPATAKSFDRSTSPTSALRRNKGAAYRKVGEDGVCKMHKYSLYETATRYYVVGGDIMDRRFRILKIDRTAESGDLSIAEDDIVYTKKEMNQLLNAVDDGNRSSGGMKLKCSTWGILGFIRFTGAYYMLVITKRSQVAMIGGHYIYQVDGTELVSLTTPSSSRFRADRNAEEARFLGILNNLDLSRSFYFSYSYNITRSLQYNIVRERQALRDGLAHPAEPDFNAMFVWNDYLLEPAVETLKNTYDWCIPVVHGFIDQATLSIYGRTVYITVIARRSRFFAGARFLKRGANDLGYVANDVETEQIVSEMLTTSFHAPGPRLFANPNYTSYVQHRGSIPLYWTQDNTGVTPKPDIELNLVDPFYGAAALHFDNLFERYGAPIYVLNLVKARERTPRESKLLVEFTNAINYLNQFLPPEKKLIYKAWDMSRASKSRDQDVIGTLEAIAEEVMTKTGFFRNGDDLTDEPKLQNGVARTNCIDCLDRTNAAQFVIGKRALGHQLHALGVIDDTSIDYDTDAVNLFTHMYHDHGDTIAIQYGGSHLVNTMETYRKINQWTSHSRDMVESFKRYYNNSFLDGQRQEAYNLFLGNYIFAQGQPMLWDLATDYYLHHADPRAWSEKRRRNYIKWFTPAFLEQREMPPLVQPQGALAKKPSDFFDDYWLEYYRPLAVSSFQKIFSYKMNSTLRYIPSKSTQEYRYDLSPFRVRTGHDQEIPEKKKSRKGVKILEPQEEDSDDTSSIITTQDHHHHHHHAPAKRTSIQKWLQPQYNEKSPAYPHHHHHGIMKEPNPSPPTTTEPPKRQGITFIPSDKTLLTQWTLDQFVSNSLNPSITSTESAEYERYINHPLNLPLVLSNAPPPNPSLDFLGYVNSISPESVANLNSTEEDIADYADFLTVSENPLTVVEEDMPKKRYKAYRQWLRGKSLFKQQRVDPEYSQA